MQPFMRVLLKPVKKLIFNVVFLFLKPPVYFSVGVLRLTKQGAINLKKKKKKKKRKDKKKLLILENF